MTFLSALRHALPTFAPGSTRAAATPPVTPPCSPDTPSDTSPATAPRRSRVLRIGALTTTLLLVAGGAFAVANAHKTVTLDVDGEVSQVSTFAGSIAGLLEEQGVETGERDVVAPGSDAALRGGDDVVVRHAHPVTVLVDGEGTTVWTTALNADEALTAFASRGDDVAFAGLDPLLVEQAGDAAGEGRDLADLAVDVKGHRLVGVRDRERPTGNEEQGGGEGADPEDSAAARRSGRRRVGGSVRRAGRRDRRSGRGSGGAGREGGQGMAERAEEGHLGPVVGGSGHRVGASSSGGIGPEARGWTPEPDPAVGPTRTVGARPVATRPSGHAHPHGGRQERHMTVTHS